MSEPLEIQKIQELPEIPKKVKTASAKILHEYGYSIGQIQQMLDFPSKSTVHRITSKPRSEIGLVDVDTWNDVELAITKLLKMKRSKLEAKIMQKMEVELDTKPLPFGSLAFGLKVLGELNNPRGQTNVNLNATNSQIAVQVIRGNVSYNNTTAKDKGK